MSNNKSSGSRDLSDWLFDIRPGRASRSNGSVSPRVLDRRLVSSFQLSGRGAWQSSFDKGIPCALRLLVTPAITTFPSSSNNTTAGRCFTSCVSANWIFARNTSPGLDLPKPPLLGYPIALSSLGVGFYEETHRSSLGHYMYLNSFLQIVEATASSSTNGI